MLSLLSSEAPTSYFVFGAKVTPMTGVGLIEFLQRQIEYRRRCILASLNMHALSVGFNDPVFRRLHLMDCTYVHIDGMPIVLLCRLAGLDVRRHHRVACLDFIWPLARRANLLGWRVYYVGSEPSVLRGGLRAIAEREPGIQIAGHTGYFDHAPDAADNIALLRDISEYRPDIILVGMGMGIQERWIVENLQSLPEVPICTVGALMEYLAGSASTPPRWMGNWGIEWCYRFAENPRRFWHRYLVEPLALAPILCRAFLGKQVLEVQGDGPPVT